MVDKICNVGNKVGDKVGDKIYTRSIILDVNFLEIIDFLDIHFKI